MRFGVRLFLCARGLWLGVLVQHFHCTIRKGDLYIISFETVVEANIVITSPFPSSFSLVVFYIIFKFDRMLSPPSHVSGTV